jgi:Rrf2 family nitric oxide-sensitive transcriptional repressor
MRLSRFTDYSLRVLLYVAAAPEGRATIGEIARAFDISAHHLVKVVHFLGREGLLANSRGRGGGLRLGRSPTDINLGRVVRLTEGGDLPAECFNRQTNRCVLAGACGLERALRRALEQFYAELGRHSLAELQLRPRAARSLFELARTP